MAAETGSTCGGPADSAKVGSGIAALGSGRILRLGAAPDDGVGCIVVDTSQTLERGCWNDGGREIFVGGWGLVRGGGLACACVLRGLGAC